MMRPFQRRTYRRLRARGSCCGRLPTIQVDPFGVGDDPFQRIYGPGTRHSPCGFTRHAAKHVPRGRGGIGRILGRELQIEDLHFDAAATAEVVDDRLEGDVTASTKNARVGCGRRAAYVTAAIRL